MKTKNVFEFVENKNNPLGNVNFGADFLCFFVGNLFKNNDFYDVFVLKKFNNSGNMFLYIIFNI